MLNVGEYTAMNCSVGAVDEDTSKPNRWKQLAIGRHETFAVSLKLRSHTLMPLTTEM